MRWKNNHWLLSIFALIIKAIYGEEKSISYEQKLINVLKKLPSPLEDKRHNLVIYFNNDRARSNQSRFEHIVSVKHGLKPGDIERIPRYIKTCIFKRDIERNNTYSIYIKRNSYNEEYIKLSIEIRSETPNKAVVKTIFITTNIK